MIQRLKFRGKDREGKWHFSDEYKPDLPAYSLCHFWGKVDQFNDPCKIDYEHTIDPSTVSQWTGALDETGVEIYEDDIVLWKHRIKDTTGFKYRVVYNSVNLRWELHEEGLRSAREFNLGDASWHTKRIGTIHDAPKSGGKEQA